MGVKVAIVGCGGIGHWHFSRLKDFEDVVLVGFCDIIPERAESMAEAYRCSKSSADTADKASPGAADKTSLGAADKASPGAVDKTSLDAVGKVSSGALGKAFTDVVTMYDETKPDAVYICVPPAEHGLIEFEAIKRGIHFLVQKPIALDMALITKIRDAAAEAKLITSVGFQDRYLDIGADIKNFIDGRAIGLITGSWVGGIPGVPWWRKKATSGGQLVEQNIHLLDMLRYFIGEPVSVCGFAGKGIVKPGPELAGYDVDDYSGTLVKFANGAVATILTGDYLTSGGNVPNGLTFYAADATVEYHLRHKVTLKSVKAGREESATVYNQIDQGIALDRTFIDAVKTGDGAAILSTYADAAKTMAFALACNESMESGRVVML